VNVPVPLNVATAQPAPSTRATQSPAIALPPDATACRFQFRYFVNDSGDDSFSWSVILDGTRVLVNRTEPQAEALDGQALLDSAEFAVPAGTQANPHVINAQFVFHHGVNGASPAILAVQDPELDCASPGYGYLSGTSMATPHVTGTAALMFSLVPSATVTQVRTALLAGVDKVPSLAGLTVTGGRLNAWKALAALVPMDTRITSGPSGAVESTSATFTFDTNNTGDADFQCQLDGGAFVPCTSPQTYSGLTPGSHSFHVRSWVAGGVDTTPAETDWTVARPLGGGNATCNGLYDGSAQNVTVSNGANCTLMAGTVVSGNVQSDGGSVTVQGPSTTIKGNVQAQGGGLVSITDGVMIGGNLQVQQLAPNTSMDSVCGATINGNLQWQNNRAPVTIGAPPGCQGNQVGGNLQVQNNTMPSGYSNPAATIEDNTVRGNLQSQNNTPAAVVAGNTVKGKTQTS
jgi:Subtilase family